MVTGVRIAALAVLAACGWVGADGIRRAGAAAPFDRVYLPWDANRLPEAATEARILSLKPVSPFARFRDALARADGADGQAFRTAARGVLRWGRNQPGTLVDLGRVALARWKERHEPADREVGEDLLVEYTGRTTHAEGEGAKAWLEVMGPAEDPWGAFQHAPRALWQGLAATFAPTHPEAAWKLFTPALETDTLDPRYASYVVALARNRRLASDLTVLRTLAARGGLPPEAVRDLRSLIAELEALR